MSAEPHRAPSDDDLARLAVQGDAAAFEGLCLRVEGPVYGYLRGLVQHTQEAEDLAQETLLRLYRLVKSGRLTPDRGTTRALIFSIAHNLALDHLRRRRRPMTAAGSRLSQSSPDSLLRGEVDRAMAALPETQRVPLMLREFGGLSYAEIAETLQINVDGVKIRIFRARKRLAELLDRDGQYVGDRNREL